MEFYVFILLIKSGSQIICEPARDRYDKINVNHSGPIIPIKCWFPGVNRGVHSIYFAG